MTASEVDPLTGGPWVSEPVLITLEYMEEGILVEEAAEVVAMTVFVAPVAGIEVVEAMTCFSLLEEDEEENETLDGICDPSLEGLFLLPDCC